LLAFWTATGANLASHPVAFEVRTTPSHFDPAESRRNPEVPSCDACDGRRTRFALAVALTRVIAGARVRQQVEEALGVSGSVEPGDVYKVSLPRSDLKVTADGVQIKPSFALGSWLGFKQAGEHTAQR
jgi:Domain of Unknown Function (DUF1259)